MPKTFNDWLKVARRTDDPVGDLVHDTRSDSRLPPRLTLKGQLKSYLTSHGACNEALEAVDETWARYTRWRATR